MDNTNANAPTIESSQADVWYLKEIHFGHGDERRSTKVITQNFNGPCSFIAICNILILRGDIEILPAARMTVFYEQLSQLVGEYLLVNAGTEDISAALSVMPCTQKGMDLNPLFTGATSFRPAGDGGELKLFDQANIRLLHGWLVDPHSAEAAAVCKVEDYDSAVNLIVAADHTAKGQLVVNDDDNTGGSSAAGPSSPTTPWTSEERSSIEDALVLRHFLESTASQLTYHGLFTLVGLLEPGVPVALFRNSHLSVLYKPPGDDQAIYTLVTDYVFLREPSVVWERIEDVDGGSSTFVDSDFIRSSPAGGDFAGQTAEEALRALEQTGVSNPADVALAQQLQAQEDDYARQQREEHRMEIRRREQLQREAAATASVQNTPLAKNKMKKEKACIIM